MVARPKQKAIPFDPKVAGADRAEWTKVIGEFMVAFNDIEHVIDLCIENLASDGVAKFSKSLELSFRCSLLTALLDDFNCESKAREAFKSTIDRIGGLTTSRNLIAHNSPITTVYMDTRKNVGLRVELRSRKKTTSQLKIGEAKKATKVAIDVSLQLLHHLSILMGYDQLPGFKSSLLGHSPLDPKE